eukprot:12073327-Alexandrium_andersonii.AAC.1
MAQDWRRSDVEWEPGGATARAVARRAEQLAGLERAHSRGWSGPAQQWLRAPEKEAWIVQVDEIPGIEL